jgi:hypothetical protein
VNGEAWQGSDVRTVALAARAATPACAWGWVVAGAIGVAFVAWGDPAHEGMRQQ